MLMRANIQAVSLKIQTLKSQNAMAQVCIITVWSVLAGTGHLNTKTIQKLDKLMSGF
jgi:hypothetical protein